MNSIHNKFVWRLFLKFPNSHRLYMFMVKENMKKHAFYNQQWSWWWLLTSAGPVQWWPTHLTTHWKFITFLSHFLYCNFCFQICYCLSYRVFGFSFNRHGFWCLHKATNFLSQIGSNSKESLSWIWQNCPHLFVQIPSFLFLFFFSKQIRWRRPHKHILIRQAIGE